MTGHLVARRPEGPRGWLLTVAVPPALAAAYTEAGQYCQVAVAGEAPGYFAVANAPGAAHFEFYVQPAGGVSDRLAAAMPGQAMAVSPPMGAGYGLADPLASPDPIYVLAAGSGLSGVRAALQVLHAGGRRATVYVGLRTPDEAIFRAELAAYEQAGSAVVWVESRPSGRYVQTALAEAAPDLGRAWVLACGPSGMVAGARATCAALGLPPERFLVNA